MSIASTTANLDLDTSWCPICDRQILPRRYLVPVKPQPSTVGGLAHGTGRLRQTNKPKMRTVIDQGPTPLYCSDECRLADLHSSSPMPIQPVRTYSNSDDSSSESSRSSNSSSSRERGFQRSDDSLNSFYGFLARPSSSSSRHRGDDLTESQLKRDDSSRSLRQPSARPRYIATAPPQYGAAASPDKLELRFARSSIPSSPAHSSPKRMSALQKAALDGKILLPESTKRRESSAAADAAVAKLKSRTNSVASLASLPATKPEPEARSWSYDNLHTYEIMQLPPRKEKKTVVVDGMTKEIEVDVYPERKRLFLFPGPSARRC